jgi:hypothetical protein
MKQIEHPRIVVINGPGAVIPQILIELRKGSRNVTVTSPIDNI